MSRQTRSYTQPEELADTKQWLPWLKDPQDRLKAARAYRKHPRQDKSREARQMRLEAALVALGYTPAQAALIKRK